MTFKPDHDDLHDDRVSVRHPGEPPARALVPERRLLITLTDERDGGRKEIFQYKGRHREFVEHLNKAKEPVHDKVISIVAEHAVEGGAAPDRIELALQWNASYSEQIFCYTNNVHNKDGGTHLTGLRSALTKVFNSYGPRRTSSRR
jgi:DNA gyrase subunit B